MGHTPEATSLEGIAFRQALYDIFPEPYLTTQSQHKAHIEIISGGITVRQIKGVPILILVGELAEDDDNHFIPSVYRKRHLKK